MIGLWGLKYISLSLYKSNSILRFFLEIAFNGKNYHGWQNQPDAITVQQTIEGALSTLFQRKIDIVGAGRTDTGVHARQIFAHFDLLEDESVENLVYKLNSLLPKDIAIYDCFQVKNDAHARFDAITRTYRYYSITKRDPFLEPYVYTLYQMPNLNKMNEAAQVLFQYHDFQCFSKSKTDVKSYLCTISEAFWEERDNQLIFTVSADRFLRNMVRAIVGTLLEVGFGKSNLQDVHQIIQSKNRSNAGKSVPAQGLFLENVTYPESIKL